MWAIVVPDRLPLVVSNISDKGQMAESERPALVCLVDSLYPNSMLAHSRHACSPSVYYARPCRVFPLKSTSDLKKAASDVVQILTQIGRSLIHWY